MGGEKEYYIELDDEEDDQHDEDIIILSNEAVPKEIGFKKGNKLFNTIPDEKLKNMNDDDDIIDYFLEH